MDGTNNEELAKQIINCKREEKKSIKDKADNVLRGITKVATLACMMLED